jgi:hypothetical protein
VADNRDEKTSIATTIKLFSQLQRQLRYRIQQSLISKPISKTPSNHLQGDPTTLTQLYPSKAPTKTRAPPKTPNPTPKTPAPDFPAGVKVALPVPVAPAAVFVPAACVPVGPLEVPLIPLQSARAVASPEVGTFVFAFKQSIHYR